MKILIIGEKPSIAKIIANSLGEKLSYKKGYYEGENFIVSNCVGHLLRTKKPSEIDGKYKSWSLDNLPFDFDYLPLTENEATKDQLRIIKTLFKRDDIKEIVNACDADREGELIFRNLIEYLNPKCKNISRMWIESVSTADVVKKQFEERLTQNEYKNLYQSALARSYADYFLGLNATMAMTSKFGNLYSIGRVITPTLKIVVDLEKKIRDFVSTPFYKVVADTNLEKGFNYVNDELDDNRFEDKKKAEELIKKVGLGPAIVKDLVKKEEKQNPPKLYSLSDLQIECAKKYKMSAQDVLDSCQELYEEYGLTTYPRTSENMISPETVKIIPKILKGVSSCFGDIVDEINTKKYEINKKVVAKKDIGSHEALTPTDKILSKAIYDKMPTKIKNVYNEIVLRFLANFYPEAIYSVLITEIERNGEVFKKTIKRLTTLGYTKLYGEKEERLDNLKFEKGDTLSITLLSLEEGKTEPPKRFTEGTLIKAMQNPMKYLTEIGDKEIMKEAGGLGTEATRAGIIENMKKYHYIEIKKNTIYATDAGIELIDIIPSDTIKSVPLTAKFEHKLKEIKDGTFDIDTFLAEIKDTVRVMIEEIKSSEKVVKLVANGELCKCPNCGSSIVKNKFGFGCSNWKECKVEVYKDGLSRLGKPNITQKEAVELLTKGKTSAKAKFISQKSGKPYEAYILYEFKEDEKYPNKLTISFE